MIELLHAAEVIERLLDDPDLQGTDLRDERTARRTMGVGIIEAPRGTLIHHYEVDSQDLVTMCNLIVSTTHNNQAMNEAIREVARQYLDGHEPTEGLAQSHRGRHSRVRSLPVVRHARRSARCRWRSSSSTHGASSSVASSATRSPWHDARAVARVRRAATRRAATTRWGPRSSSARGPCSSATCASDASSF